MDLHNGDLVRAGRSLWFDEKARQLGAIGVVKVLVAMPCIQAAVVARSTIWTMLPTSRSGELWGNPDEFRDAQLRTERAYRVQPKGGPGPISLRGSRGY
jgi:hypothetical protein